MKTGTIAVVKTCENFWFAYDAAGLRFKGFGQYGNTKEQAVTQFIKCLPESKNWKIEERKKT